MTNKWLATCCGLREKNTAHKFPLEPALLDLLLSLPQKTGGKVQLWVIDIRVSNCLRPLILLRGVLLVSIQKGNLILTTIERAGELTGRVSTRTKQDHVLAFRVRLGETVALCSWLNHCNTFSRGSVLYSIRCTMSSHNQKVLGLNSELMQDFLPRAHLHVPPMSLGAQVSSHSPKTCWLGQLAL